MLAPRLLKSTRPLLYMQTSQLHTPVVSHASSRIQLARLPVPDMHQTLQRYLKSLEPLILEDDAQGKAKRDSALAARRALAEDFERGIGSVLQQRLQALDRASPNNWLDDTIWLNKAYHEWRLPVIVNSNWWLSFIYDRTVPEDVLNRTTKDEDLDGTGINRWQVRRAAWLTWKTLELKAKLQRQEIYPDSSKTGIWFRKSTDRMFNICRIPRPSCDAFSTLPHLSSWNARTILVSARDWLYALEVLDQELEPISPAEIERSILEIVGDVSTRIRKGESAVPISVLTADDRDRWAENYSYLSSLSPRNIDTLQAINHSIMGLSLDHYTYTPSIISTNSPSPLPAPDTPEEVDAHLANLRSSHTEHPAHNRWFDKPYTLIVESNTRAGALGEHSPVDALVPSIVAEYSVVQEIDEAAFGHPPPSQVPSTTSPRWKRLDWEVDDRIRQECVEAEERARKIAEDSDDGVLWFKAYGSDWIKKTASLSPDAYVQMAIQLAWYRTRKCFTATYETALTRLFRNGRTETIRTLSTDSRAWVLAMEDPSTPVQTRHSLLKTAVTTHAALTRAAATGKGVDRHLLGLRCMLRDGEQHELFEDELFARSQEWKLSTSGLSAGHQFRGTGFGAAYHDGYGINYLAGPDGIKFGIESKHSCPSTSTAQFKEAISDALLDMQYLCSHAASAHL